MKIVVLIAFFLFGATAYAATVTVSNETQLVAAVNGAASGDVIVLNGGTYTLSSSVHAGGDPNIGLDLDKPLTIRAAAGATPVINFPSYIGIRIRSSTVTLDGLTVAGPTGFAIQAQDDAGHTLLSALTLRRLTLSTSTGSSAQGIGGGGIVDSIVEYCTVSSSDSNGMAFGPVPGGTAGSNRNLIVNNTVQNSAHGHGIGIISGDYNIIAGNTISNTVADGIIIIGGQHNYIAQNAITNPANGITLTKNAGTGRQSIRNYVGNNSLSLNAKAGSDTLWFNFDSNYNMGFLNDGSGAQENGVALFNSIGNYFRGNNFHNNPQGGIYVTKDPAVSISGSTIPTYNSIQQNYLHDHPANGGITTQIENQNDFGFNYVSGNPAQISSPIAGILAQNSINSAFYSNVIRDLRQAEQVQSGSSGLSFYLNRHINTVAHLLNSDSSALFDSGSTTLGGNYFSDFTASNGNPSNGATPYTNITDQNSGHPVNDRYPYASENLGKNYSIAVRLPSAGSYLATSTYKQIAWSSQGCVAVDLYLVDGSNNVVSTIASNTPDYGYYRWLVPNVASATYKIRADCKTASGAGTGKIGYGPSFQTTTPDLVLLSPQANLITESGAALLVSWKKSSAIPSVDIYIRYSDAQAFSLLQAGVTADFLTISTPVNSSNRASVRIGYGANGDSTDGWFTIRGSSAGQFTSPASTNNLFIGTSYLVEWIAPQGTDSVALDVLGSGGTKNLVTRLGDFSSYLMLVPDLPGAGATLRLTFYNAAGSVLQTVSTPAQNVQNSSQQPDSIAVSAGSGQSAAVNATFATPLQASVTNGSGSPVAGVAVVFTQPGSGASGSFGGSATVITNGSGIATAPAFTANGVTGNYSVVASTGNLSVPFTLTNTAAITSSQTNIGYYYNSIFVLDVSGNGVYDGPPVDKYFFYVTQQAGDIAVTGDWNGDGRTKVGIYRNGFWVLDYNGNGVYDYPADKFYAFGGNPGEVPVVGDWNGDGRSKIGVYRQGFWLLDYNGNGVFDGTGAGQDRFIALGGNANEYPLLGDWNHDGRTKVGVFYNGNFALDYDGDGVFTVADRFYAYLSYTSADRPIVGDWNGNGFTKIGIYRSGFWILDYNGNGAYDYPLDRFYAFGGNSGETPLIGDWNGDGRSKIGINIRGFWQLDFNGNGNWDGTGAGQDRFLALGGNPGEQPLIGKW